MGNLATYTLDGFENLVRESAEKQREFEAILVDSHQFTLEDIASVLGKIDERLESVASKV